MVQKAVQSLSCATTTASLAQYFAQLHHWFDKVTTAQGRSGANNSVSTHQ